jgi:predicted DNA-binding protein
MTMTEKPVRQSVTLPPRLARRVKTIARSSRTSANRVLVELIESGLEARELERRRFFELADRLAATADAAERAKIKDELARMTFGD